ncbi:hypothetical protein [Streptomyces sp. NPDC048277]|uniref:hypothetical protein n=1 Tax=Streptomyces sp. NPDC048277 TaxID=3155027 RepID=UPI00340A233B
MNLARKLATGAMAVGLTAAGLFTATPADAASGGGCDHETYGMSACISAGGNQVLPDFYITILPNYCTSVRFSLVDVTANKTLWSTGVKCADMHGGPWHINATAGHAYMSELTMYGSDMPITSHSPISYW